MRFWGEGGFNTNSSDGVAFTAAMFLLRNIFEDVIIPKLLHGDISLKGSLTF